MKVGFHFDADHEDLGDWYGPPIKKALFLKITNHRNLEISSKVFVGDLLFHETACDTIRTSETSFTRKFNPEKFAAIIEGWINPNKQIWFSVRPDILERVFNRNIYVLCFESIDKRTSEFLAESLMDCPYFLGALEVDDTSPIHWMLYSNSLIPLFRIEDRKSINIFNSSFEDEDDYKDIALEETLVESGFKKISYESLNGKFTIFDQYHDFEHARRVAEWRDRFGNLLAFIADDVVSKLIDTAPDLGNRLWAAFSTFEKSETSEELAQVSATCRRIMEYVVDSIFPPTSEKIEDRELGEGKYKNRLYAWAKEQTESKTEADLITIGVESLDQQYSKLLASYNKGVHGDVLRIETRRCLLKTVFLLDDIVSLKTGPFEIKPKLDFSDILSDTGI